MLSTQTDASHEKGIDMNIMIFSCVLIRISRRLFVFLLLFVYVVWRGLKQQGTNDESRGFECRLSVVKCMECWHKNSAFKFNCVICVLARIQITHTHTHTHRSNSSFCRESCTTNTWWTEESLWTWAYRLEQKLRWIYSYCYVHYPYCYVYVFLLLCMLCSVYSVFIVPTGILRLPWLRFCRAFSSAVRQMPGYSSHTRGTVRTLPN